MRRDADIHPLIQAYFKASGWRPFPYQADAWRAYAEGRDTLIHAPTGTGKTLAAWLAPINQILHETPQETNPERKRRATAQRSTNPASPPKPLRRNTADPITILWITPMRALATDTAKALTEPLQALGLNWTIEKRTGDTSAALKLKQKERLPTALITTPESLSLILSHPGGEERFASLRCVIVDEWHELLSSKRGVQTELALARLRRWLPNLRTIGLSATLGNLPQALEALAGNRGNGSGWHRLPAGADSSQEPQPLATNPPSSPKEQPTPTLIHADLPKTLDLQTVIPEDIERFPWAGHLGLKIAEQVAKVIDGASTTLVFTNTRSQSELWFRELLHLRPDWLGRMAIHHGSLERALRQKVEDAVKAGQLKCVVCTSSLDLGVDFSPVEQVIQIGSPKGVARLMQRAGRSGHRPNVPSRVVCVPTHAFELVEFAAAREALIARDIEPRVPLDKPLDVLAQHVVTTACAAGDAGFDAAELLNEARSTHAYKDLTDTEWGYVLDFAVRGGAALHAYPQFARITRGEDARYRIASSKAAREHRLTIGTISSDNSLLVKVIGGATLGTIEESAVARLAVGDRFIFAGIAVELVRLHEMTVMVRRAKGRSGAVPKWVGGQMSLSSQLAARVRATIAAAAIHPNPERELGDRIEPVQIPFAPSPELIAARPLLDLHARLSHLPHANELLIESTTSREGFHVYLFPFEGRSVHEGLGAILARRLARLEPRSITVAMNDYGLELSSPTPLNLTEAQWRKALDPDDLLPDLAASVNTSEMTRRRFRDIARVAGLINPGFPATRSPSSRGSSGGRSGGGGFTKRPRHVQASADLFFDVFTEFDPVNFLLEQAKREVINDQLQIARIHAALRRIASAKLVIVNTPQLTPLSFPIWAESLRTQQVTSERWGDRVKRMALMMEEQATTKSKRTARSAKLADAPAVSPR